MMSHSSENVSILFLQQLGINSINNRDDGKKLAKLVIGLYDSLGQHKAALRNMQQKLVSTSSIRRVQPHSRDPNFNPESTIAVEVLQNANDENFILKEENRDLREENVLLKKLIIGVDDAHPPLKKCLEQILGIDVSGCETLQSLCQKVAGFRSGASPAEASNAPESSFAEIMRSQKEILRKLEEWTGGKRNLSDSIKELQGASEDLELKVAVEAAGTLASSDLQLSQQLQTLNQSMYNSMKKLVLAYCANGQETFVKFSSKNFGDLQPKIPEQLNPDYVRRLIATAENLKSVNQEILKNETLSRHELESTMTALRLTRAELEKALSSYDQMKAYKSKLEASLTTSKADLDRTMAECVQKEDRLKESERRAESVTSRLGALQEELEVCKGTNKQLKREKDILMATYCRVMKENERLRDRTGASSFEDAHRLESLQQEVEKWRHSCEEWERHATDAAARIGELEQSIAALEDLKNDYATQIQLLQRGSSEEALRQMKITVAKLEGEKRDLQAALGEESRSRTELEEMCVKLDKARRALKDQIQFIRNENERVLESVKKQIRTELFSIQQTPMLKQSLQAPQLRSSPVNNEGNIQELIDEAKEVMRQAAEISSPGYHHPGGQEQPSWEAI